MKIGDGVLRYLAPKMATLKCPKILDTLYSVQPKKYCFFAKSKNSSDRKDLNLYFDMTVRYYLMEIKIYIGTKAT